MSSPTPQLVRIGVRNKGCAGLSYHLEYVDQPAKFDEVVEQDGVRVIIDSKALFSIIGSEMDWHEDALRCVFSMNRRSPRDLTMQPRIVQNSSLRTLMLRTLVDAANRSP